MTVWLDNWAITRSWQTRHVATPVGLAGLRQTVASALSAGRAIRPMGSKYSFSACIVGDDLALDFRSVADVRVVSRTDTSELPGLLTATALQAADGYAYVQPGAQIHTVCQKAKGKGLAPFTLGGSTGQTVIGAVSTSTHGAGFELSPLPEYVDALHVLSGAGEFWIERPSQHGTLTIDAAVLAHLQLSANQLTIYRDRAPLDAALVALGAGGVVAGALLRLRSSGALMNERLYAKVPWLEVVRPALLAQTCFTSVPGEAAAPPGTYRELEVILDPYASPVEAYLSARTEAPVSAATPVSVVRGSPDLISFALKIGTNIANYSGALAVLIESSRLRGKDAAGAWVFHAYADVIDAGIPTTQPVHSYELVWPVESIGVPTYLTFLDECIADVARARAAGEPFLGTITLRFSRGTTAMLGMQHADPPSATRFAHVEISPLQDVLNNKTELPRQNRRFLSRVFASPSAQAARLHWGQGGFAPLRFDASRYPMYAAWRHQIGKLVGAHGDRFQSAFTRAVHATP